MKLENIVIYCGSHFGAELSYASFAGELAEAIAKSGRTITYGGGTVGLMGIVVTILVIGVGQSFTSVPILFAKHSYYGQFTDTGGIYSGDKVRIAGVDVGAPSVIGQEVRA